MKKVQLLMLSAVVLLTTSCKTKSFIYVEDLIANTPETITNNAETHVKPGDRLAINIFAETEELAAPFNTHNAAQSQGKAEKGYLVDKKGDIRLPLIGKMHVEGLTLDEVSEMVRQQLATAELLPNADVETNITNFTIYGLGALSPGKLTVEDGHITLLQAIAQMGDLQARAKLNKVRVIREEHGIRTEYDVDITKKDIYNSPAYHLQQNDIVYAEPKRRSNDTLNKTVTGISILAVLASIAYSVAYILK